eukprot:3705789-Amphidinium_carterae.1
MDSYDHLGYSDGVGDGSFASKWSTLTTNQKNRPNVYLQPECLGCSLCVLAWAGCSVWKQDLKNHKYDRSEAKKAIAEADALREKEASRSRLTDYYWYPNSHRHMVPISLIY